MGRGTEPSVIAFVGDSDSGKTTLLEQLIPLLSARGLAVASVKHASHGFDADRPRSDSHRHYTAGAQAVVVISDSAIATFERRDAAHIATLEEALATLPDGLDLVLVEGFGWESIPRLILVPPDRRPRDEHRESGPVLRVIRVPESAPEEKPAFSDDLIHSIALGEHIMEAPLASEPVAQLEPDQVTGYAVAVWDGAQQERAGIKGFSGEWRELRLAFEPMARK